VRSVYDEFRAAGYSDCELFGVNYLSVDERATGTASYHTAARARILADFITDVKRYTGKTQVDVVAHSLGVTVALEGLRQFGLRSSTRRFIAIAGGLRGLSSCYYAGYANPLLPVCGSANWFDSTVFGLYPHTWYAPNPRMGDGGLRDDPALASTTRFYSLSAGYNDQVACTTSTYYSGCAQTNRFDARSNVYAQLDVGAGSTAGQYDFDFSDWSPFALGAGDIDGVGHFRAKNDTGAIQVRMLTTACTGTACCTGYAGACR
jgi:pimeloyl-ACP methyl ester carboxylesterase